MEEVLFSTNDGGVATITLNRPEALNSLSFNMLALMKDKLKDWEQDDSVRLVILQGAGAKSLCAGGDIKTLYGAKESPEGMKAALQFFEIEYEVDQMLADFSKPVIANLNGIVMGGGVGLSYGANYKIVTERTKWAMPEMNIGFFPDVGGAYFLNKAPGHTGRYLALTASTIPAADVIYANAAEAFMTSENLIMFLTKVEETNWQTENITEKLEKMMSTYTEEPSIEGSIAAQQAKIDEHFFHDTVEAIIESLEADDSEFAVKTKETLLSLSPVSLKVTLKQLIDGEGATLGKCLQTDLILAKNFMDNPDFFEGVRSVLIDKDRNPQYKYNQLEDVSSELVNSFFV